MATKRQRPNGTWEFVFKNKKLMPRPFYATFDTEEEGDAYERNLQIYFKEGILPAEIKAAMAGYSKSDDKKIKSLADLIKEYKSSVNVPDVDVKLLDITVKRHGEVKLPRIDIDWAEAWVSDMKRRLNLAPSTIRHHVGALARCFDWAERRQIVELVINPLRRLPRGYSTYTKGDAAEVEKMLGKVKENTKRKRRLELNEEEKIRAVLNGAKLNDGQRRLELRYRPALILLFDMAMESAMRMREMFTLTLEQIDIRNASIHLDKTKNGDTRDVPMTTVLIEKVKEYVTLVSEGDSSMNGYAFPDGRLFPWWSGAKETHELTRTTSMLSRQFARIFEEAGCEDLHFHDLRHEATSRFFERTDMDFVEIANITGHKDPRMLLVYANLRANKLAKKLW